MDCSSAWGKAIPCIYPEGHCGADVPHIGLLPAHEKPYAYEGFVKWDTPTGPLELAAEP